MKRGGKSAKKKKNMLTPKLCYINKYGPCLPLFLSVTLCVCAKLDKRPLPILEIFIL